MTIHQINLTSDCLQPGKQCQTSDGKIVTLKHVCIEEAPDSRKISLADMEIGQRVRIRDGRLLTLIEVRQHHVWPYLFKQEQEHLVALSFTVNGNWSAAGDGSRDIVEILPLEPPGIRLHGIKVGQEVRDRTGRILIHTNYYGGCSTWPYEFEYEDGTSGTFTAQGIFGADLKPSKRDIVEILPCRAPRVSLVDAKAGDRFHLRDGRTFIYTGTKTRDGNLKARREDDDQVLVFGVNGSCPGLPYADVIKVSRPDLFERIARQLQRENEQEVSRVQIASSQWLNAPLSREFSVPLEPSDILRHNEFSIVFKTHA